MRLRNKRKEAIERPKTTNSKEHMRISEARLRNKRKEVIQRDYQNSAIDRDGPWWLVVVGDGFCVGGALPSAECLPK